MFWLHNFVGEIHVKKRIFVSGYHHIHVSTPPPRKKPKTTTTTKTKQIRNANKNNMHILTTLLCFQTTRFRQWRLPPRRVGVSYWTCARSERNPSSTSTSSTSSCPRTTSNGSTWSWRASRPLPGLLYWVGLRLSFNTVKSA